ncbi:MAG: M67 family metallopeptidase [Deltaproteobacteria bacterium]
MITAQARKGLPHEVCGYLAEKEGRVAAHYELSNIDTAADHFSMKPEEQFAAVKDMRGKGLKLRGVYHSHPETPARPSLEDIRLANDPEISYVIISLAATEPAIKSFRIIKGEVTEEPIEIIEG